MFLALRARSNSRVGWVQLPVEGCGLGGLVLLACQLCEVIGEGVGDAKVHQATPVMRCIKVPDGKRKHGASGLHSTA